MSVGLKEIVGFVVQQLIVFAFQPSRFSRSTFHVSHPHAQGASLSGPDKPGEIS